MTIVHGCDGCRGTAGAMGCPVHGNALTGHQSPMFVVTVGRCGHSVLAGWNFCPDCGASLR